MLFGIWIVLGLFCEFFSVLNMSFILLFRHKKEIVEAVTVIETPPLVVVGVVGYVEV